jgi:two-component system heavy metal sensor histidine kinase CusS
MKRVPPPLSLSTRLLIAFTAAAFATLVLAMVYINRAVESGLIQVHEDVLGDHLAALKLSIADNDGSLHAAEMLLQRTIGGDKNEKSFGCLTNASGEILIQTPGFSEFSPPLSAYPPPAPLGETRVKLTTARSADGHPLFLSAALIPRPGSEAPLTYYFTADTEAEEHFTTKFRLELALVLLFGTLMSAGLAWLISHHGLRPILQITEEIEQTTAKALQQPDTINYKGQHFPKWPREIVRLSDAFAALRNRLGESLQQMRQFSDDAAHEIRTPLSNMMGLTSLTLRKDRSPEEYQATLISILEECDRLKKLADGLLFISRADHRLSALALTEFDAREAITEVVEYHSDLALDRGVTIATTGTGVLTADRSLFRQALNNLLSNALRHTPSGGRIGINFAETGEPDSPAVLTVTDTGGGIAPEHLPHILDRFYRVDTARSQHPEASPQTGLGLAIVKAIVELHNGSVRVHSELGQGATFILLWPSPMTMKAGA